MSAAAKSNAALPVAAPEVFTLSEAAAYLRVSEKVLRQLAEEAAVPGRKLGKEWRFLKSALQDWLRVVPVPKVSASDSKQRLLALAGVWKDDPTLDELLKGIYKERGRPMIETEK
jgi:excisionase family DNA binding protein